MSEPGFVGLGDYHDLFYIQNRGNHKIPLILVQTVFIPPPFEKLAGDLPGAYSSRINIQHRLVYQVTKEMRAVKVIRMWSYYE